MEGVTEDKSNPLVMAILRQKVMPHYVEMVRDFQKEMRDKPISTHSDVVEMIIAYSIGDLCINIGATSLDEFSYKSKFTIYKWIVGELNSALPTDYPYIISIVFTGNDRGGQFAILRRNTLPGCYRIMRAG